MKPFHPGKSLIWLVMVAGVLLATSPSVLARLGSQFQMPLGNPDGASTNTNSRTKFLINQRGEYVISYNGNTHQANWVGWSYSLADDGTQTRTDAWAVEELLPAGYLRIGTATFGTGWDRGHMTPSADRTLNRSNNEVTFRMSNIIPQASQNNQGLWANFEDYCRGLAADGDEVVIISGPAQFTGARLNNQMSIPGSVWKIAVEIPSATSSVPANERITTNARVIALLTPNTSVGLGPWQSYITSVEQIEDVTGFTFFDAITNSSTAIYLKNLVDTGTGPNSPTVITTFNPTLGTVGSQVTISGFNFGTSPTVSFNGTPATVQSSSANSITVTVPSGATSGFIEVQGARGTDASYEPFTVTAGSAPTLTLAPTSLAGLTANQGFAGTSAVYALTGSNLTTQVTVTAPQSFEVSKDNVSFATTQTLNPEINGVASAQLYVRIKSDAPGGSVAGPIAHTSGSANANLPVAGTVVSTAPNLSLSATSITGLTALQNSAGSSASYTVTGANLAGNITVSASPGFQVSANNTSFGNTTTLSPVAGALDATVYVRIAASPTAALVSGTITHSGGGIAADRTLAVSGNVISTAPTLALSTNAITGLTAVQNSPGGSKTYTVSGTFLTNTVTVGAPNGFEIGTNASVFTNSLVLTPSSGTLPTTTIFARLAASGTTGARTGNITHTSSGITQDVSVSGSVNPPSSGGTQEILARWTFENPAASVTNSAYGPVLPEAGIQTNSAEASGLHTATNTVYSFPNGNGSPRSLNANNWTTNDYYQFRVGMAGYQDLRLRFDQTGSSTGPAQFRLAYSTNGTSFVTFTNYDVPKTNSTTAAAWSSGTSNPVSTVAIDLSSATNINDSSQLFLRLLPRSTVAINGTSVGPGGTSRIDNVIIEATTIGTPVAPKPVINSATTAAATAQTPFEYRITAINAPTYYGASGLPAGLAIDSTSGLISGTPTTPGNYTVLLTASNANGDGTASLNITVNPAPVPVITSATNAAATLNASFQFQITANNSPTSYGATNLPPGLSLDPSTGLISGIPTTLGVYDVSLTAGNAGGNGTAMLRITVDPDPRAPVIGGTLTLTAAVGVNFNYQITASNSPNAFLAENLPLGLMLDPVTGTISGTPQVAGVSTVGITAINSFGRDTEALTITVLTPTIDVSASLLEFTSSFGQESPMQTYNLTGSDLGGPITVLAPGNFEINDSGGSAYFDELTINPAPDRTLNVVIRVRMKASAPLGENSGAIIHSGADAVPKYVELSGFADVPAATLDLSTWSLTGFSTKAGTPSLTQSYTVSGAGLTQSVTVTAPSGFQISKDNNTFASSFVLSPDATGKINAQEVFVRLSSSTAGSFGGSIAHTGGGAEDRYLAVSGTVTLPVGPPIISPLSGSAYTNASYRTRVTVGGTLPATSFAASGLPGTLQMNRTNGIVSGVVPTASGTNVFSVSATTQEGTTTTNYTLRVVSSAEQSSIPTSVVVNKFQNGLPDRVELLVIGDASDAASGPPVDMRGMVLKDFSLTRTTDDGGKFRFANHDLWSRVRAGTLIVLSAGNQSTEDTDPSDFVLRVNLGNTTLMRQESPGFDIDDLDMVMVKPAAMGVEGFAGGIHALAAGRVSGTTIYGLYTGRKIRSDRSLNSSRDTVYAAASSLSGYSSSAEDAAIAGSGVEFGLGNTSGNRSYITSLRGLDQTPPTVTLNGDATVNLAFGGTYTELGASVSGGISATATVSGSVDTRVAGTYVVTYSAVDNAGNAGTATRTVIVGKGTPLISALPTASPIVAGQRLSASALTGGSASFSGNMIQGSFAWLEPDLVAAVGTSEYAFVFIPADGSNYTTVSGAVSVTANQASGFAAWIASRQIAGTNAAPAADPDGDGAANLTEFAWGSDPSSPSEFPKAPDITRGEGSLKLTAILRNDDPNLEVAAETTSDLRSAWSTNRITEIPVDDQTNVPAGFRRRTWEVQDANPAAQFIRLNMRYP